MFHFLAVIHYDGSNYAGWQKQAHAETVEGHVMRALSNVANESVSCVCAGRTDSGVHALYQVISFTLQAQRTVNQLVCGANSYLPIDIRVDVVVPTSAPVNARFAATYREYLYIINTRSVASPFLSKWTWHLPCMLNLDAMQQAANCLLGERNFQSFRSAGCQSHSNMRDMICTRVWQVEELVCLQFRANAFLYHMVRNVVGSLVQVGLAKQEPSWIADLLALHDRSQAAATAPATGLYLSYVHYADTVCMPNKPQHFLLGGSDV